MFLLIFKVNGKWYVEEFYNEILMHDRKCILKSIFSTMGIDICSIKLY